MRKFILALFFSLTYCITPSFGQLFTLATDTVCPKQPVKIIPNIPAGTKNFYWGFCSGFLNNPPNETTINPPLNLSAPGDIEIAKQGANYYGFVVNAGSRDLVRLDYGIDLSSDPISTNLGDLNGTTVENAQGTCYVEDDVTGRKHLFVVGGIDPSNSSISRVDFSVNLENDPNNVNYGNIGNVLNAPSGIFVQKDSTEWFAFVVNALGNNIIRLDYGTNLSGTPKITNLGNLGNLDQPSDITGFRHTDGEWYLAITNMRGNSLSIIRLGKKLKNDTPLAYNTGNISGALSNPSGLTYIRDCGIAYFYVTNVATNELIRVSMQDPALNLFSAISYNNPGGLLLPSSISNMVRNHDSIYAFVPNANNSVSRIKWVQCKDVTIQSYNSLNAPEYAYTKPGTYNIYLSIDEGLPTAQVQCSTITVIPYPGMEISNDTVICQGGLDTIFAYSPSAMSFRWYPDYNLDTLIKSIALVTPEFTTTYHVVMDYENGCIVDTSVTVSVVKIKADAGPDRVMEDGASTILGGPGTTVGPDYKYTWYPNDFLETWQEPSAKSTPLRDFTYYLHVETNQQGIVCQSTDTVVVRTQCNEIVVPNAFMPNVSETGVAKFGIINKNIIQLNEFKVFDRWGKLVFTTSNPSEQWDGTIVGQPAPQGVYMYTIDAFCAGGKRMKKSGNVTLIR